MKVFMVDPGNYSHHQNYLLCKALNDVGENIILFTSVFHYEEEEKIELTKEIKIRYFFFKFSNFLYNHIPFFRKYFIRRVMRAVEYPINLLFFFLLLLIQKVKVVHFQWLVIPPFEIILFIFFKIFNIKIVYTAHNVVPHNCGRLDILFYSIIYRVVDEISIYSEAHKEELISKFNIRPSKIKVILHGNFNFLRPQKKLPMTEAKEMLEIDTNKKTVLFFGQIMPYKGLTYLIKAFHIIKKERGDAMLMIVGKLSEPFSLYEQMIREFDLEKDIYLNLKFQPTREIHKFFNAADVVVIPYIKAYQSGILLLSYAFGRPVVVTRTADFEKVLEEGKTGYIVPVKNEKLLAEAIIKILKDPNKMKEMGCYSRMISDTRFSWTDIARETAKLYKPVQETTG